MTKLPSAEELLDIIVKIMLAAREDGSVPSAQIGADACKYILSYRNAVLEAAAEVALESAEVWQAVRDIRALKEDL